MSSRNRNAEACSLSRDDSKKNNVFESAMVSLGSLVIHIFMGTLCKAAFMTLGFIRKAVKLFAPMKNAIVGGVSGWFSDVRKCVSSEFSVVAKSFVDFSKRRKTDGFFKAFSVQCKELFAAAKKRGSLFKTFVNYAVPVASVVFLISVVSGTASRDYGITVEINGQELGVVTEESVISDAQQTISEKSVFYDTDDEIFVTANLSIKPLNALDEVIDEVALAQKLEEQLDLTATEEVPDTAMAPVDASFVGAASKPLETEENIDGKVRAYSVTVDGVFIGAVTDTSLISEFIEEEKEKYLDEDVVSAEFDRNVEFDYEQYYSPDQIVDSKQIIDKFNSIVSEPVYYEIQDGDSPWDIAVNNDMSLDELLGCFATFEGEPIDDITSFCPVGGTIQLSAEVPYLQMCVTKNVVYTDTIDYDIVKTEDSNLYKGETVTDVAGVEGEAEITALITYKNNVPISKEIISEKVISEPVTKQVRYGTRATTTAVSTGSGGSGSYFWPVEGGYISAYFGDGRNHKGIDIAAPYGTKIYAAETGTVTRAGNKYDGYGNCVMVSHNDGNVTMYAHMSSIAINYGDYVVKGQLIGYVGSTGDSTGNHCHFEVRTNGVYNNPTDYVSQY